MALLLGPGLTAAVPVGYDLTFQTSGQSIWGTGTSTRLDGTTFLGAAWQDQRVAIGGIGGHADTDLINLDRSLLDQQQTPAAASEALAGK